MYSLKPLLLLISLAFQWDAHGAIEDSLRTKWINGKKFVLHQVETGETWNSLSMKYGCEVDEMIRVNNGVQILKAGQIVQIPTTSPNVSRPVIQQDTSKNNTDEITHMVKKGETLFAISRRYGVSISEIKRLNGIMNEGIVEGRVLIIKRGKNTSSEPGGKNNSTPPPDPSTTTKPNSQPKPEVPPTQVSVPDSTKFEFQTTKKIQSVRPKEGGKPIVQVTETGLVDLVQDNSLGQGNYYCLHRSAPLGTIIKMTDNETGKSVYLKVMGNIPGSERSNTVLRVSMHAIKAIGNSKTPFPVELTYSILD